MIIERQGVFQTDFHAGYGEALVDLQEVRRRP
jgi:hypothetical protein